MKLRFALVPLGLLLYSAVFASDALLTLPDFRSLEGKATESVKITLDSKMLGLAASFLDSSKAEDAAVKDLVSGLRGIYVRSFSFDADFAYPQSDIDNLRRQLTQPGWQRLIEVRSRKQQTQVDVYMLVERNKANGLAIIASEPREFTIINIVGSVDLRKLHQLEGRFGVPRLELEEKKGD